MSLLDTLRSQPERLTEIAQSKITPSDSERLDELVERIGTTRSAFIRALIVEGMDRIETELNST